ncbi:MAG: hypothetical protein DMD37_12985, partial [Gemmatimonadetes bacterium]
MTLGTETIQPSLWGSSVTSLPLLPGRDVERGEAQVLHGDAFDLIAKLRDHSVDLIITSPPYWGQPTYNGHHNWDTHAEWRRSRLGSDSPPPYRWYAEHGGLLGL